MTAPALQGLRHLLSPDELGRCQRSPLIHEQNRFIAGRGALREILASYLEIAPAAVQFAYGHAGKPYLINGTRDIRFNISHSADLALIAVSLKHEIGIDLEFMAEMPEMADIAARFFSESAKAEFFCAEPDDRMNTFYKCWTEKEAISKCTGVGITEENPKPSDGITLMPLSPASGYAASLAVLGNGLNVQTWRWNRSLISVDTEQIAAAATGVFL